MLGLIWETFGSRSSCAATTAGSWPLSACTLARRDPHPRRPAATCQRHIKMANDAAGASVPVALAKEDGGHDSKRLKVSAPYDIWSTVADWITSLVWLNLSYSLLTTQKVVVLLNICAYQQ